MGYPALRFPWCDYYYKNLTVVSAWTDWLSSGCYDGEMNGKWVVVAALVFLYVAYGAHGYAGDVRSRMSIHVCPPGEVPTYINGVGELPECPNQTVLVMKELPQAAMTILGWPLFFFAHTSPAAEVGEWYVSRVPPREVTPIEILPALVTNIE